MDNDRFLFGWEVTEDGEKIPMYSARVGKVQNYYGELYVIIKQDKYFLEISCDIGNSPTQEISKELFDELLKLELRNDE